jgi:hypothetical protein
MNVTVHQTRQNCFSADIDNAGGRSLHRQHVRVGPYRNNPVASYRERLRDPELLVYRYKFCVVNDEVWRLRRKHPGAHE